MADKNQEDLDKQLADLASSSAEMATWIRKQLADQKLITRSDLDAKKKTLEMTLGLKSALTKTKKSFDELISGVNTLKEKIKTTGVTSGELEEDLESLRYQVARTTDADKKAQLIKAKSELESLNAQNKLITGLQDATGKILGIGLAGAVSSMTSALKAAASGGNALEIAAGYQSAQLDITNQKFQAGAGALTDFGKATAGAGGFVGQLGIAATIAGGALGFVSNQITELAKSGIGFLLAQTNKMITGFQDMSRVGAVFSDGMMGITNTASMAGMTVDQFSKVVDASRKDLSSMGMGLSEASRRMASVFSGPAGKKMQDGMYALGMTAEEQGQALAQTMAIMAGPSGKLKASNAEVQAQTAEYAKNLKIISNITGEDAKAKMEKLRQDNDTLAFNGYLNTLNDTQRKKTVEAMNAMSAEDARAFREKKVYNTVVSADLNAMRATNSGIRKAQDDMFEAADRGTLSVEGVAKTYETFQAEALAAANEGGKSFGLAMSGIGQDLAKTTNSTVQYMIKFSNAQKGIAEIAESQNKGVGQSGAELMKANQDFANSMQTIAIPHIKYFGDALQSTISMIKGSVVEADKALSGKMTMGDYASKAMEMGKALLPTIVSVVATHYAGEYLKSRINSPASGATESTGSSLLGSAINSLESGATASTGSSKLGGMGRIGSTLVKAVPGLLKGGAGLAVGYGADMAQSALASSGHEKLGAGAGILGDAAQGALMGSMIGPIGTVLGGLAGAAIGTYKNWDTLTGKTATPATAAAASMNPTSASMSNTTPEGKPESDRMYDKIVELATSSKAVADALSKDVLADMAKANQKMADAQRDLANYSKDMRDTLNKLLQVSR